MSVNIPNLIESVARHSLGKRCFVTELEASRPKMVGSVEFPSESSAIAQLGSGEKFRIKIGTLQGKNPVFSKLDQLLIANLVRILSDSKLGLESRGHKKYVRNLATNSLIALDEILVQGYLADILKQAWAGRSREGIPRLITDLILYVAGKKIEGKSVLSGIAIFSSTSAIKKTSSLITTLSEASEINDFTKLKTVLPLADGESRFVLTVGRTLYGVGVIKERNLTQTRPVLITFGRKGRIRVKAHLANEIVEVLLSAGGRFKVPDLGGRKEGLLTYLLRTLRSGEKATEALAQVVIEASEVGKGAAFIIGDPSIKDKPISGPQIERLPPLDKLLGSSRDPDVLQYVLAHTLTDGAILLDQDLGILAFGAILPIDDKKKAGFDEIGHGARHNSARAFSEANRCVAIVVSEDGPISIYINGTSQGRF